MTIIGSAFVEIRPQIATSFSSDTTRALTDGLRSATTRLSGLAKGVGKNITDSVQSGLDPSGIAPRLETGLREAATGARKAGQAAGTDYSAGFAKDAADRIKGERGLAPSPAPAKKAGAEAGSEYGAEFGAKAQDKIKENLKHLAELAVGFTVGAEALSVIKESVEASEQLGSALRVTQAVITATGNAAGLTAQQVQDLARSLSFKIGINTTDIERAANVLLTFRQITGDTFKRTLAAASNLQGVFKTDLSGAALQLGKALNDPANGLSKLARSGVSFTDQQKNLIKTLQASGDLLGAQNIILGEVQHEFGGAGEAAATASQRFSVAITNLKQSIGGPLAEALDKIAPLVATAAAAIGPILGTLGTALAPVITGIGHVLATLAPALAHLLVPIGGLLAAVAPLLNVVAQLAGVLASVLGPALTGVVRAVTPAIKLFGDDFTKAITPLLPVFDQLGKAIGDSLTTLGPALTDAVGKTMTAIAPLIPPLADALVHLTEASLPLIPAIIQLLPPLLQMSEAFTPILIKLITEVALAMVKMDAILIPLVVDILHLVSGPLQGMASGMSAVAGAVGWVVGGLGHLIGVSPKAKTSTEDLAASAYYSATVHSLLKTATDAAAAAIAGVGQKAGQAKGQIEGQTGATKGLSDQVGILNDAMTQATTLLQAFLDLASGRQKTAGQVALSVIGDARQQLQLYLQTASGQISKPEGLLEQQQNIFKAQADILPQLSQLALDSGGNFDTFRQKVLLLAGSLTTNVAQSLGISTEKAQGLVAQILKVPTQAEFTELINDAKVKPAIDQIKSQIDGIPSTKTVAVSLAVSNPALFIKDMNAIIQAGLRAGDIPINVGNERAPFAYGGLTTEDHIDHNGSNRREVVIPLDRGRQRILELLHQSGLEGITGQSTGSGLAAAGTSPNEVPSLLHQLIAAVKALSTGDTYNIANPEPYLTALEIFEQKQAAAFRTAKAS